MRLGDCKALVTGSAVRIGRAIVEALADAGCGALIHCHRSADEAKALARDLSRKTWVAVVQGDLALASERQRVLEEAWERSGGFQILVNNASIFHKDGLESATDGKLARELQVNYWAPTWLAQAFYQKLMQGRDVSGKSGSGRILGKVVHLLDQRVAGDDPACIPYMVSKKMLAQSMRESAVDWAPHVTVNGVAPGAILPARRSSEGAVAESIAREAAGPELLAGPCGPAEVAEAVLYILRTDTMTGQILFVDNGQHLLWK